LFNYLARLDAYPVHFQPSMEPQEHIFHWKPHQSEILIEKVDLPEFEKSSGISVDYILLWGSLKSAQPGMPDQVQQALFDFSVIYKSPDGLVMLYKRQSGGNGFCVAPALPS